LALHLHLIEPADHQRHFGHSQGLPQFGAVEDHVFHFFTAQRLGALFSQDPQDGIHDVALAASVRTDDRRHAIGKLDPGFGERLKPHHLKRLEIHALLLW